MVTLIVLYMWVMVIRVREVHRIVGLPYGMYIRGVVVPIASVVLVLLTGFMVYTQLNLPGGLGIFIAKIGCCIIFASVVIWYLGLDRGDRKFVTEGIRKKIHHKQ